MKQHLGSTIAIVMGILLFGSGAGQATKNVELGMAHAAGGIVAILGAIAYRSAKKRAMGQAKNTAIRVCLEIAAIVVPIFLIVRQREFFDRFYVNPFCYGIIPLWVIIAYVVAFVRKRSVSEEQIIKEVAKD